MKTHSWERIKEKCKRDACTVLQNPSPEYIKIKMAEIIETGKRSSFYDLREEAMDKAEAIINSWDIRQFEKLRNVFPKNFPKGILKPEYGENGWVLTS